MMWSVHIKRSEAPINFPCAELLNCEKKTIMSFRRIFPWANIIKSVESVVEQTLGASRSPLPPAQTHAGTQMKKSRVPPRALQQIHPVWFALLKYCSCRAWCHFICAVKTVFTQISHFASNGVAKCIFLGIKHWRTSGTHTPSLMKIHYDQQVILNSNRRHSINTYALTHEKVLHGERCPSSANVEENNPCRVRMIKLVLGAGKKSGIKHHFKATIPRFASHRKLLFHPWCPTILWQINNTTTVLQIHTKQSAFLHV